MDNETFKPYKEASLNLLRYSFPELSDEELLSAIDYSIEKRLSNPAIILENNYKKQNIDSTLLEITDYIMRREPIITSYGVIFSKHESVPNPLYKMVQKFIDTRKVYKKEMFKYEKGSELYAKYDLLQLLSKRDVNALYGAIGKFSCIYYNVYTAASVTAEGREANAAAALLFESILNNNVPFNSFNELMMFINNTISDSREFKDNEILDRQIDIEECFAKLIVSCGFGYVTDDEEKQILWDMLWRLSDTDINRLYYKNNLFAFIDNSKVSELILVMLQKLNTPYMDPNETPEEIKDDLNLFYDLLYEYVYYSHQIIDRTYKMKNLIRSVSLIQDTDSAIISFDGWYRFILNKTVGIDMAIKNEEINIDTSEVSTPINKVQEYSFLDDSIIERDRVIKPNKVIPQDGLKFSIINIMAHCIGNLANDYMEKYTMNSHSYNPSHHKCFMSLKNEFMFSRILLKADAKKNYASVIKLREGHIVPDSKSLDVKGMPAFVKSTMNETTREKLKKILYEDILTSPEIDQVQVIKDLAKIEKEVFDSIQNGEKLYYKPVKIKSLSSYDEPFRQQGVKAAYAYNLIHTEGTEAINLEQRNSVTVIKVKMDSKNIDCIREEFPDVYIKALEVMVKDEYKGSIEAIALPANEPVPKWVLPFVDYNEIINDCIRLFPIESIGLHRGNNNNNYTNIIKF